VEALTSPFHTTGVHLQLTSAFANSAQQGSFFRTMLHIDANDLTFTVEPDGSHKSTFNVVVFTFGAYTGVVDQTGRTYTIGKTSCAIHVYGGDFFDPDEPRSVLEPNASLNMNLMGCWN